MTDNIVPIQAESNASPFESIRRHRIDGSEYWSARELMPLLGYRKWERFGASESLQPSVIQRAIISAKMSGTFTEERFPYIGKTLAMPNGAQKQIEDCELSRYACYLVAMCGDVTKPQIATAQSYFAIKTREAEVLVPQQSERIRELELEIALRKAEAESATAQQKLLDTRHYITTALPEPVQQKILGYNEVKTVEYRDRTITPNGEICKGVGVTYLQKRYGFKSTKDTWAWLESIGCGKFSGHWETQLVAVDRQSLPRDLLGKLDELAQSGFRQPFLGE